MTERRLAAILSADVVGYSRLMAEDEDETVRRLTAYREQIGALVREHRGRVTDFSGDCFLAEFSNTLRWVLFLVRRLALRRAGVLLGTVVLAVALFGSHRVEAVALVYFEEDGGGSNPRGLYNYDTATGVSTLRATVSGSERFFGMDVRLSDRTVFAADLDGGLWTMDINTGTHTLIGATGLGAAGSELVGLAFHPMTDDLFGLRNNGGLYSINPLSGVSTFLGDTSPADRGLSFSPSGQLFAFTDGGDLYLVDPTDGNVAAVGGTGNPITGISEDSAFAVSGELFATDFFGTIFQTDTVTGNGFVIGTTGMGNGLLGLIAVPEPSTGLLLGMGLATLLVRQRRRR